VEALKAGIQRSLALSIEEDLHALASDEVAFLYEIGLNELEADGQKAIQDALRLNLSTLSASAPLPRGVREIQNLLTTTRKKGHTLKLNVLGIYNFTSMSELTLKGTILTDPASGQVLITDGATATRVSGGVNFLADPDKLRKALAQSVLVTAAYRCSGLIVHAPALKVSYWHFAEVAQTDRATMAADLHALTSVGLISAVEEQQALGQTADFGRSTFYLQTDFDDALSQAMFIRNGKPRAGDEYEEIGRRALQLLIPPDSKDAYRLRALDAAMWPKVKGTGGTIAGIAPLFPDLSPDLEIPNIAGDCRLIAWWAETMAHMAQTLSAANQFFSQVPRPTEDSPAFKNIQSKLWHQMADVASKTQDRFSDPWGILAMDLASNQQSHASARIVSPNCTLTRERN
jgi:hypothetical protein